MCEVQSLTLLGRFLGSSGGPQPSTGVIVPRADGGEAAPRCARLATSRLVGQLKRDHERVIAIVRSLYD